MNFENDSEADRTIITCKEGVTTCESYAELPDKDSNNIKVVIRVRPFNEREEIDGQPKSCIQIHENRTLVLKDKHDTQIKSFNFDFVGDPSLD